MASERPGHQRADAQANRARIVESARAALEAAPSPSMKSIASQAGVGQGTLYRHFPTREALVLEVHRRDVEALVEAAPALLERHQPLAALRQWLDQLADYGRLKYGLGQVLERVTRTELAGEGYEPVIGAIQLLLDACADSGDVKQTVDAEDILLLVSFLWRAEPDANRARTRQLLDVIIDGLRTRP